MQRSYIYQMISEGEHLTQDFKFGITDSRKIARTLSAFANTQGGRLLVGVKDNGAIAGVRSDEEFYMIQAASQMYTRPNVPFSVKEWTEEGKTVLEVWVDKGNAIPYTAPDKNGKYQAYVRVGDQNYVANIVLLQVWLRKEAFKGAFLEFSEAETSVLQCLQTHGSLSMNQLLKYSGMSRYRMIEILVNFILMKVVKMHFSESGVSYLLTEIDSGIERL